MAVPTMIRAFAGLASPGGARGRLSILIFHRVLATADPIAPDTTAEAFEGRMRMLKECFNVLPLAEGIDRLSLGSLPVRAVAITFDDGYADNFTVALPVLQRHRLPATFFIATGFLDGGRMWNDSVIEAIRRTTLDTLHVPTLVPKPLTLRGSEERRAAVIKLISVIKHRPPAQRDEAVDMVVEAAGAMLPDDLMMTSDQVRCLRAAGMEIGGHTVRHPILAATSADAARHEIASGRETLQAITGEPVRLFAYPNGVPHQDYRYEHTRMVRDLGFDAAVSTAWGSASRRSDKFQLPRFTPWDRNEIRFALRLALNARRRIEQRA